jgi:hypothetical protein
VHENGRELRPAKNEPPRFCNFLAEGDAWQADPATPKIREFHQNGVVVLPTDLGRAFHWRQTEIFDRDVSNYAFKLGLGRQLRQTLQQRVEDRRAVRRFEGGVIEVDHGCLLRGLFQGRSWLLGLNRKLPTCEVNASCNDRCRASILARGRLSARIIRGVLYLTDVSETNGPFQYKDSNSQVHTVVGKVGDLLVFDAMRLPHRAKPTCTNGD